MVMNIDKFESLPRNNIIINYTIISIMVQS